MKTETVPIEEPTPDPANARKHDERNLKSIIDSLRAFGQQKPIVVDGRGIVVAGNGTLEAAKRLGWTEIAIVRSDLDPTQATAFGIADNRTAELAEWDDEVLRSLLDSMDDEMRDVLAFDQKEIDALVPAVAVEVQEDEIPEQVEPRTKPGDLWLLGRHRLLCGDSTKAEDVERLMDGEKADAIVTDPPYGGILNKPSGHGKLKEAAKRYGGGDWDHRPSSETIRSLANATDVVIWGGNYFASDLPSARCWLVWDKRNGKSSFADAELAWTNIDQAVRMHSQSISSISDRAHPTQKPIEVMAWSIGFTSGLIFDPYLGSGTTLIAAEQFDRRCFGMEIDPAYCDVIVRRWENLTGEEATRCPDE